MQGKENNNNKIWLGILSAGVVIALGLGTIGLVNSGDTKANAIPTINQQVDNINNTLPELEKVSDELKSYIDTLETTGEKLQKDLTATNTSIDTLETEVYGKVDAEKTATLNQLKADKAELESKIVVANKALEDAKAANATSEKAIINQIAALKTELEKTDGDNKNAMEDSIAALEEALTQADGDNKKALEDSIAALKNAVESNDASLATAIQTLNTTVSALIKTNADNIAALQTTATDLQKQINDTNTNIDNIKTELDGKISDSEQKLLKELNNQKIAIETELSTINNAIAMLQAKDVELDQKLVDIQAYVDGEIGATMDWAETTFATLAQYEETQSVIADIKQSITALESATGTIEGAYTQAIEDAILASETAMKEWVNKTLADGYYDIAEIDAMLGALETKLAGADADLAKEIDDQQVALEKAKTDLTAAYEKAITDAINTNNGAIDKAIADAVQEALDKVDLRLAAMDNDIAAIQNDIEELKSGVAMLEQQITDISITLEDLKGVDATLQTLINNLQAEATDLRTQLDNNTAADIDTKAALENEITNLEALITALQAKDVELEQKIADVEIKLANYEQALADIDINKGDIAALNTELDDLQSAVTATMAVITADITTANGEIAALKDRVEKLEDELSDIKDVLDNKIQSITFVKDYADGKVEMDYTARMLTLRFIISPAELASQITADNVKAYVRYTSENTTRDGSRIISDAMEQTVVSVSANGEVLTVDVKENGLSEDFWSGKVEAVIYIVIDNGNNTITSEMIPMVAHSYAGVTATVNGWNDGRSETGEASE